MFSCSPTKLHHCRWLTCVCRLSLSWSRILPGGGRGTAPNAAALRFYTTLLQQLHSAGITPVVTLYHFDLPQVLQVGADTVLNRALGHTAATREYQSLHLALLQRADTTLSAAQAFLIECDKPRMQAAPCSQQ